MFPQPKVILRPDKPISKLEFWFYRHYRSVHGVRIAIAFLLCFIFVRATDIPEGTWPLITLVVVMGPISTWGMSFRAHCSASAARSPGQYPV